MSEELIQRNLIDAPEKMGLWNYYNIGGTTLKALKGAKIIPDRDYDDYESKKPDVIITNKPIVIAAVEYKQPRELRTERQIEKAIAQELGTAQALKAKIYIVTDGTKTFWINPLTGNHILNEDGTRVSVPFSKDSSDVINLMNRIMSSISKDNDMLKAAAMVDPLPLAEKVWQDLWAVSGATPENCLYTFVEIFIFKYLSDLGVLRGIYSFSNLLAQYADNDENEVLEFYASTVRVKIKELFPGNPKDKTTIINGTIFVSKDDKAVSGYATVFRRILNRFESFGSLENIDYDFKSKLFETFLKESISKKNWGQYFTPLKIVRAIIDMIDVVPGMKICDPACGVGKFLLEPILHQLHKFYAVRDGKLNPQITLVGFDKGFDKDEQKTIILAKANMLIYMSSLIKDHPDITEQFAQLFNSTFILQTNSILGTLAKPIVEEYDLILTNPPYVMSGSSNLKEEISKSEELKKYFSVNAMGIEGLFMEWIVRALKPGGKAFVVVPDGIMNRGNDKRLREFILDECIVDAVISLPLNTFFTTNKKTYILALTKKIPVNNGGVMYKERQSTPVFTYLCSEIGETRDVYRFEIEQNDLKTAATLFNMFKGAKNSFSITDKRCKLIEIDRFINETHWAIDRWWSKEEKIEIGIEESVDSISLSEFVTLLSDVSSSILEYQEPLIELEKKKIKPINKRVVRLTDEKIFNIITQTIGKNKTSLTTIDTCSESDIPVYSAAKYPIAHIKPLRDKPVIECSEQDPVLSFASNGDGSAGTNFVFHTKPFYINADRIAIRSMNPRISLSYISFLLKDMKQRYGFNHAHKANRQNLANVVVEIPVDENGDFDLNCQLQYADLSNETSQLFSFVLEQKHKLSILKVEPSIDEYMIGYFPLNDVLNPVKGKSIYTKKYGELHKGQYPVYSASSRTPLTYIDSYDYDGKYITWSTNGFAGTILVIDGKFSVNGDRGVLLPKDNRTDLCFEYLQCILEPIFRDLAKGRKGDNGEDEFTKLYPSMLGDVMIPFPVDKDGNIDFIAQQEIAQKYLAIDQCKEDIINKLGALLDLNITP